MGNGTARSCAALPKTRGRMRTSGRGRAEAAWGTYSRRLAKEKAEGLSGPFFRWSPFLPSRAAK